MNVICFNDQVFFLSNVVLSQMLEGFLNDISIETSQKYFVIMWRVFLCVLVFCSVNGSSVSNSDLFASQTIKIYSTTKANPDFVLKESSFGGSKAESTSEAVLNATVKYQKITGFGGTFTDATGINLNKLPADVRKQVLEALFSDDGIGINLCRVPIGGTEFSTRLYTLDDHTGDTTLKQFVLQNEDLVDRVNTSQMIIFII